MNSSVPKVSAIIPARGGSRGIPRKNLRLLAGVPLVAHTILAARACPHISGCLLTSEDPEIRSVGLEYGAETLDRPAELAGDLVSSQAVVRHALEYLAAEGRLPEYFALLQPTSPLRTGAHLTACIEQFFRSGVASAISVTEAAESPFKAFVQKEGELQPLFDCRTLHAPRQLLPRVYNQNGAIYLTRSDAFLATGRFFIPPVMPFVMEAEASVDIDTDLDWRIATCLISG